MTEQKLIFKKIAAVMSEIGAIGKDRQNTQQKYSFRGIDDVYNAAHPLFVKHGIFSVPRVLKNERSERVSNSGGVLLYSIVEMEYTFYAEDGSNIVSSTVGEGMDSGDKATNKAMAAAHKYAIVQLLSIPTEEAKDSEHDDHKVAAQGQAQPAAAQAESKQEGLISEGQQKRLFAIGKQAQIPEAELRKILAEFGFTATKDIHWKKYDQIVKRVENWKQSA